MTPKPVLLDSTPLSLLCGPPRRPDVAACRAWRDALLAAGHLLVIPEIIDYEVRRELIRARKTASVDRLGRLQNQFAYLPLSTPVMVRAAELWAAARQRGRPTANNNAIDVDMILVAQAEALQLPNVVIATANVKHLSPLFPAELWPNIAP